MNIGDKGEVESIVSEKELACNIGSGDVEVYSTPSMIALMEAASVKCLSGKLNADQTSVGTTISIKHLAATPKSLKVRAVAEITDIQDGKKVSFNITAFDEKEKIGEGTHERFILNKERFTQKTNSKLNK
ncbi:hypothetical protein DICPUDRAFT_32596 [Dictyostelium purpureum]|uniref:Fluoroacetyl-CoA-specific thioesterase-like domain-containing protein n=1 Tax=Dictyostelium purpureum TaxID=5786 RepID=F0ZJE5_DICPU|nr:uncharacterized protein DICPUDRAFT_32596 [Dictyostelium purpureum]EGC35969.1 hypothetical protein DICPUDRAFT_32596 [Dictyostelium purpureum]|eukprot:XP_003287542.1 hypothetical protein DICPUDRAFT_32596 [Dictyostelium purpureum]